MVKSKSDVHNDLFSGLISNEELRHHYIISGWLESIPLSIIPAHWLYADEQRLDGGYYAQEAIAARRIIMDSQFPITPFGQLVKDIWYPNRFKRVWSDPKFGVAFLGGTEILHLRPDPKYISRQETSKIDELICSHNSLLITRSGSVGRVVLANKTIAGKALSEHVIRIDTKADSFFGYYYAFLSSKFGQTLLVRNTFGSAVSEIEPHHISSIPIPILPENEQQTIHEAILRVYGLRDEANDLLDRAETLLHEELSLPIFNEGLVPYLTAPNVKEKIAPYMPHPKAFSIQVSELDERFDGSYHVPTAHTSVKLLREGKYPIVKLAELADSIIVAPRFKRIYVPKEYGVPLLQGSHLPQIRPQDLKYVSKTLQKNLEKWIVQKGWVLVTCSGTIGRVGLVSSYQDQWAASQHILRIKPNMSKGHPGYLAAFLMTAYGQYQVIAKTYGGVVDEITSEDTGQIWVPNVPLPIQVKIGELVIEAYEKKDQANLLEDQTITHLEKRLEEAAKQIR